MLQNIATSTSLNRNKRNSARSRSGETDKKKLSENGLLENNAKVSAQQNGLGLSVSSFNRITCNELKWYSDQIRVGHQLAESDFQRQLNFAQCFIRICQNNKFLANAVNETKHISQ